MRKRVRMALIGLISSVVLLGVFVQPVGSDDCENGNREAVTTVMQLRHHQPVTLLHREDQTVRLAGDASGMAELRGKSVVAVQFSSGPMLGYGVETLPAQDVTSLLVNGTNIITLTAILPEDGAWLTVTTPCPAGNAGTPVGSVTTGMGSAALVRGLLIGLAVLGVILALTVGHRRAWWQELRQMQSGWFRSVR